jgi:hypothetical protein
LQNRSDPAPAADLGTGTVVLPTAPQAGPLAAAGWHWDDVLARFGADFASEHFRHPRAFRAEPALPALAEALPGTLALPAGLRDRPTLLLPVPAVDPVRPIRGAVALLQGLLAPGLGRVATADAGEVMADVLRFARQALPGLAVVLDGIWWQLGGRSGTTRPVARNVLLAGCDPVAVDAVAARLAGRDPERDAWFRWWRDEGLGAVRREDIRLVGSAELLDLDFGVPDRALDGPLLGWDKLPFTDRLERKFRRKSLSKQLDRTPWGRLYDAYRTGGFVGEQA